MGWLGYKRYGGKHIGITEEERGRQSKREERPSWRERERREGGRASITLSSQSSLTAMLLGLRSRWIMPAEWTYCK